MRTSILNLFALLIAVTAVSPALGADRIKPYEKNPRYWSYGGEPVLLAGASDDDNLFQWPPEELARQLDTLVAAGGNVIRNTMSDRDEGDLRAFLEVEPGRYDLGRWNPAYWERFEYMLEATRKRGVFVQIEVWDRFDHSRDQWQTDPFRPRNNVNYSSKASGLVAAYPNHPGANDQPFFFTVPDLDDNRIVRKYQEAFVEKLLSHSLKYGHVLYCMDNETSGKEAWSAYWAAFLRQRSERAGLPIMITEMWDQWEVTGATHQRTVSHPERYDFIDLSQNTWQRGEPNWVNAQVVYRQISARPRPINNTKIYGSASLGQRQKGMDARNAVANFWRNLLGGFASSRFHRPDSGQGLNETARTQLGIVRAWLENYDVFRASPDTGFDLLDDRIGNEAYASAIPGKAWSVFFPATGEVILRTGPAGNLEVRWANVKTGEWSEPASLPGKDGASRLRTPGKGMWLAVVRAR